MHKSLSLLACADVKCARVALLGIQRTHTDTHTSIHMHILYVLTGDDGSIC